MVNGNTFWFEIKRDQGMWLLEHIETTELCREMAAGIVRELTPLVIARLLVLTPELKRWYEGRAINWKT